MRTEIPQTLTGRRLTALEMLCIPSESGTVHRHDERTPGRNYIEIHDLGELMPLRV